MAVENYKEGMSSWLIDVVERLSEERIEKLRKRDYEGKEQVEEQIKRIEDALKKTNEYGDEMLGIFEELGLEDPDPREILGEVVLYQRPTKEPTEVGVEPKETVRPSHTVTHDKIKNVLIIDDEERPLGNRGLGSKEACLLEVLGESPMQPVTPSEISEKEPLLSTKAIIKGASQRLRYKRGLSDILYYDRSARGYVLDAQYEVVEEKPLHEIFYNPYTKKYTVDGQEFYTGIRGSGKKELAFLRALGKYPGIPLSKQRLIHEEPVLASEKSIVNTVYRLRKDSRLGNRITYNRKEGGYVLDATFAITDELGEPAKPEKPPLPLEEKPSVKKMIFNEIERILLVDGKAVRFSDRQRQVLCILAHKGTEAVTTWKELAIPLQKKLRGDLDTNDRNAIHALISQIRKKIEEDSSSPKILILESMAGIKGYRLTVPVEITKNSLKHELKVRRARKKIKKELPPSPLAGRVIGFLRDNPGRVCTFEELARHVWPEAENLEKKFANLRGLIAQIRERIPGGKKKVASVFGKGYQWIEEPEKKEPSLPTPPKVPITECEMIEPQRVEVKSPFERTEEEARVFGLIIDKLSSSGWLPPLTVFIDEIGTKRSKTGEPMGPYTPGEIYRIFVSAIDKMKKEVAMSADIPKSWSEEETKLWNKILSLERTHRKGWVMRTINKHFGKYAQNGRKT